MRHRIQAGTRVESGHPCPQCETDDSFHVIVHLGDYVYLSNYRCEACDYTLTKAQVEALTTEAWESAPEDAVDA